MHVTPNRNKLIFTDSYPSVFFSFILSNNYNLEFVKVHQNIKQFNAFTEDDKDLIFSVSPFGHWSEAIKTSQSE